MQVLRTPGHRFANLRDYPFASGELDVGRETVGRELRMHYVDEGPRDAPPILMLHGEPTWSYLYRKVIPPCVAAGFRVIAPDLIGFGKSDKPAQISDHSYARHVAWVGQLLAGLDLRETTLLCQDWGSLIGLRLVAEASERFAAVVLSNGMLPTGDQRLPRAFKLWQTFARFTPILPIAAIVDSGSRRKLDAREREAYEAPFPSRRYQAGPRAMPLLVPTRPDDPASAANRAAWTELERWQRPFVTAFTSGDPITRGGDDYVRRRIPGTRGQPHETLRGGHFVQEDSPTELARITVATAEGLRS